MSNVINMGGGGMDLVTGTFKSGSHVIYSDGDASHDEIPTADKSAQVLGNSIVYAPFGLTGGATAMSQSGFWLVTDDFTALEASATASTTPKSGVTYTNGISDLTPDIISKFAAAISNNASITYDTETVYCDLTSYHRKITVGDTVPISMDDRVHDFRIVGFNTEQLTNSAAYGSVTYTGKAGIVFDMVDVYSTPYPLSSSTGKSWGEIDMTTTTIPLLKQKLPESWRNAIKSVTHKVPSKVGESTNNTISISEDLFIPAWDNLLSYSRESSTLSQGGVYENCGIFGSRQPYMATSSEYYKYWKSIYDKSSDRSTLSFAKRNGSDYEPYWIKGYFTRYSAYSYLTTGQMVVELHNGWILSDAVSSIRSTAYVSFCFCL